MTVVGDLYDISNEDHAPDYQDDDDDTHNHDHNATASVVAAGMSSQCFIISYLFIFSSLGACATPGPRVSKRKSHNKSHKKKQRQDQTEKLKKAGVQSLMKASWGRVVRRVEAVVINVDLAFTRGTRQRVPTDRERGLFAVTRECADALWQQGPRWPSPLRALALQASMCLHLPMTGCTRLVSYMSMASRSWNGMDGSSLHHMLHRLSC